MKASGGLGGLGETIRLMAGVAENGFC